MMIYRSLRSPNDFWEFRQSLVSTLFLVLLSVVQLLLWEAKRAVQSGSARFSLVVFSSGPGYSLVINLVPCVLSCGCAYEPALLLLAFSRRASGKTSDASLP